MTIYIEGHLDIEKLVKKTILTRKSWWTALCEFSDLSDIDKPRPGKLITEQETFSKRKGNNKYNMTPLGEFTLYEMSRA